MAIYKNGLLGPFKGKIGTTIGTGWRKKDVIKSLPKKSDTPPSEKQSEQRLKFKMAVEFLQGIKDVLKIDLNDATAIIIKKMEGSHPNYEIPYQEVIFSKGSLMNILPVLSVTTGISTQISWSPRLGHGASEHDVVNVISYNVSTGSFNFFNSARRKDARFSFDEEALGSGVTHIWTFISNYDGSDQSNSKYCGSATF